MVEATGPIQRQLSVTNKRDTGVFWDEALDIYRDGAININFFNNMLSYTAGETISGTVDIEITKRFDAKDLQLEFSGVERGHLSTENVISVKPHHREVKEILCMKQIVVQFPEG